MEEVWEDISLPPLNDHSPATATAISNNHPTLPSTILQDFLATPISNKELPPATSPNTINGKPLAEKTTLFGSPPPASAILLNLNSGSVKGQENNENPEDQRHKRKMKNRESATRSRARKQAYTNELELKVAHLLEENAKLRRQQEKFLAAPNQPPKRNTLSRTLTAPF
ncbi:hypothetical protein like AT4G35900 [Hibiscus trionum]|uniref:BZIP domain-containing protein n=1 Tax=Hibiscus trionum TaxID=183268 RepID=A0A9W7IU95_HIBTR|nr:hypothetical protein like AT4G35900 [Hibiscus trionum]